MPLSKRALYAAIAASIVVITLLASVVYVYESPGSSTTDRDGDGVPDSADLFPDNPKLWGNASATITVTIVNDFYRDLDYDLYYVYSRSIVDLWESGSFANGSSAVETLVPQWATGEVNWTSGHFVLDCYFHFDDSYVMPTYSIGGPMDLDLSPGEATSVTLTVRSR